MDVYSLTLGLAAGALALAILLAILSRLPRSAPHGRTTARLRLSRVAAVASLLLVAASSASHLYLGHRPGSPDATGLLEFLRLHPAFGVVTALAAGVLGWIANRQGGG